TTKRQVAAMLAEERPHLRPLPPTPFRYYAFGTRTVHPDGCVEVARAYYRVPPGRIGHDVAVQWDERVVRILAPETGALLPEHERQHLGQYREHPDDRPRRTLPTTLQLLARAATIGPHVGQLATTLHADDALRAVRRMKETTTMQLPQLLRALRHLGLGGIATSLEARLVQAQADHSAYADFLALLLQDELTRRADRLLTRRLKEAQFRDPDKTLDG